MLPYSSKQILLKHVPLHSGSKLTAVQTKIVMLHRQNAEDLYLTWKQWHFQTLRSPALSLGIYVEWLVHTWETYSDKKELPSFFFFKLHNYTTPTLGDHILHQF